MNVIIYSPAKSTMQSGLARNDGWLIEPELATARFPEGLMGWTACGDTLNQIKLKFPTLEEAVKFAESKGWTYVVSPQHFRKVKPRNYVDNFRYVPPEEEQPPV